MNSLISKCLRVFFYIVFLNGVLCGLAGEVRPASTDYSSHLVKFEGNDVSDFKILFRRIQDYLSGAPIGITKIEYAKEGDKIHFALNSEAEPRDATWIKVLADVKSGHISLISADVVEKAGAFADLLDELMSLTNGDGVVLLSYLMYSDRDYQKLSENLVSVTPLAVYKHKDKSWYVILDEAGNVVMVLEIPEVRNKELDAKIQNMLEGIVQLHLGMKPTGKEIDDYVKNNPELEKKVNFLREKAASFDKGPVFVRVTACSPRIPKS
jgi:hypothetical protein